MNTEKFEYWWPYGNNNPQPGQAFHFWDDDSAVYFIKWEAHNESLSIWYTSDGEEVGICNPLDLDWSDRPPRPDLAELASRFLSDRV